MKMKKGFVSIISLIVMAVLFLMVLYLLYTTELGYQILSVTISKNQSYYQSEGKIYMSVYDDKYYENQLYPSILKELRKEGPKIKDHKLVIDINDLEAGDNLEKVKMSFIDEEGKFKLKLLAESNFNNTNTSVTSTISLVNEIFETNKSVLALDLIEEKYKKNFEELFKLICKDISVNICNGSSNITGIEYLNYNKVILEKKANKNYEISALRESMENPSVQGIDKDEIFIVVKPFNNNSVNLFIGCPKANNNSNGNIDLSGIIFVEGDIIISQDFDFKGIIIVKGGTILVEPNINSKIQGLIITENINNLEEFIEETGILHSRHTIYKYGTYIPGFLDVQIDLIKGK
jgi:hypothetical protein